MSVTAGEPMNGAIIFIDDAHTFSGAQIALAWAVRALLQNTPYHIVCVCTSRTRDAIQATAGEIKISKQNQTQKTPVISG